MYMSRSVHPLPVSENAHAYVCAYGCIRYIRKEDCKYPESIQSNSTIDLGHHMGK